MECLSDSRSGGPAPAPSRGSRGVSKRTLLVMMLMACISGALYRPLPDGFTANVFDRVVMHCIEPVLRVTYYYPAHYMCPDARCMLWVTRTVLNSLTSLIGPLFSTDSALDMETEKWDGVEVRWYAPRNLANSSTASNGALVFIHGGGFALGNVKMYEGISRIMTKKLDMLMVSIEYRLAPETVFPGGLEDCERAIEHFIKVAKQRWNVDTNKIVIMGDSAGGNLAASVVQRRHRARKTPALKAQVLLYPLLQFVDLQSASFRHHTHAMDGLALVDPKSLAYYYMWYAGVDIVNHPEYALSALSNGHVPEEMKKEAYERVNYGSLPDSYDFPHTERRPAVGNEEAQKAIGQYLLNPDFAPLMAKNLSGLPRSLVYTMEYDILRDEGALYAQRMQADGVQAEHRHAINGFHAMMNFYNELYIAKEFVDDVIAWTRQAVEA